MVNTSSTATDQQSQETRRQGNNVSPSVFSVGWTTPGDLKFWGEDARLTVVVRESSSESEQEQ